VSALALWLESQRASVPETLWRELQARVAFHDAAGESAFAGLSSATKTQLERMRTREYVDRADALDLLTADAMITYLLEVATSDPDIDLDSAACELMRQVAGQA